MVPRGGKRELTIRGNNNVGDEVVVAMENLLRITVGLVFAGELPNDNCFVAGSGEDHVRVFRRRSDGGDPSLVACQRRDIS